MRQRERKNPYDSAESFAEEIQNMPRERRGLELLKKIGNPMGYSISRKPP
jgi:hypothetical protein